MAAAGSLGRLPRVPQLAGLLLPSRISMTSPAAAEIRVGLREKMHHGYLLSFTGAAGLVAIATILTLFLRVPKEDLPAHGRRRRSGAGALS